MRARLALVVALLSPVGCGSRSDDGAAGAVSDDAATFDGGAPEASADSGDASPVCPPPQPRAYDLDGDGAPDTDLSLVACTANASETCLLARTDLSGWGGGEIALGLGHAPDPLARIALAGSHAGGHLSDVSVASGSTSRVQVVVVDVQEPQVLATSAVFPEGFYGVFVTELRLADGTVEPVLTGQGREGGTLDGWVCVFSPGLSQAPCGAGFGRWDAHPTYVRSGVVYSTRTNLAGGWSQDLDGDGNDDLAIPSYDVAFDSPASAFWGGWVGVASSGAPLGMTTVRFASVNPTYAALPQTFDSGRVYGVHYAFPPEGGIASVLSVGGLPVGSFTGDASIIMCNVTRYVARVDAPLGKLDAGAIRWGYYHGFYQGVFDPNSATEVDLKQPDILQGCLHRTADARAASVEGQRFVAYSLFESDPPVDDCKSEQFAYARGGSLATYLACLPKNFATTGTWHVRAVDEATGDLVSDEPGAYLWGLSDRLVPAQKGTALLVEPIAGHPRFDRQNATPAPLVVSVASSGGGWHAVSLGAFPHAGPPKVAPAAPPRNVGVVAQPYVQIVTRTNCEAEGLVDVAMQDGSWVGWDASVGGFVAKK